MFGHSLSCVAMPLPGATRTSEGPWIRNAVHARVTSLLTVHRVLLAHGPALLVEGQGVLGLTHPTLLVLVLATVRGMLLTQDLVGLRSVQRL